MVTYERQDVLMHDTHGKVVHHPVVLSRAQVTPRYSIAPGREEQSSFLGAGQMLGQEQNVEIRFSSTDARNITQTSYTVSDTARYVVNLDVSNRPSLGYRRTITFADPGDIGFDPTMLICVGEVWMHVMFLTDVLILIGRWSIRHAGYPKVKEIRQMHAEAVRLAVEKINDEGNRHTREDRSYRADPDWNGIPVVESSTVRLTRIRDQEIINIRTIYSRTWRNGYAPKGAK